MFDFLKNKNKNFQIKKIFPLKKSSSLKTGKSTKGNWSKRLTMDENLAKMLTMDENLAKMDENLAKKADRTVFGLTRQKKFGLRSDYNAEGGGKA